MLPGTLLFLLLWGVPCLSDMGFDTGHLAHEFDDLNRETPNLRFRRPCKRIRQSLIGIESGAQVFQRVGRLRYALAVPARCQDCQHQFASRRGQVEFAELENNHFDPASRERLDGGTHVLRIGAQSIQL